MGKEAAFVPQPGQVDFTNIRWAPVMNCVVKYQNKILLVERSKGMRLYPEHWNGISGFLDDQKSLEEKVREELGEELGLSEKNILSIEFGQIFDQDEPEYRKTWIVHPILVHVDTDRITLDWEAQNYRWITLEEVSIFRLLPGFDRVLSTLFGME
jgi:ADP-ribose pyrophosphatase YjhB (NUDIX family)